MKGQVSVPTHTHKHNPIDNEMEMLKRFRGRKGFLAEAFGNLS